MAHKARELDETAKLRAYRELDTEFAAMFDEYEKLLKGGK